MMSGHFTSFLLLPAFFLVRHFCFGKTDGKGVNPLFQPFVPKKGT